MSVAELIAGAGVVLALATSAVAGAFSLGALVFAGWAMVPYALFLLLARRIADRWSLTFAAVALLLAELYIRAEVFLFPKSSTAALVLIFSPLYLTCLVLPAGLGVGWLSGWAWRRSGVAGRAAVVAAGAVCLLAGGVAYFRPGLLPGGAGRLVSAKERIGPPRLVAREGFFTKTRWSRVTAWHQVGEFDGTPGTEVARIEASGGAAGPVHRHRESPDRAGGSGSAQVELVLASRTGRVRATHRADGGRVPGRGSDRPRRPHPVGLSPPPFVTAHRIAPA
jgi:hypothetical protein